jgi:cytochrome c oxidase subunit 4
MDISPHDPTLAEIDHAHGDDHSGHVKIYRNVFFSLLIFTLVEYFYAHWFKDWFSVLVLGLMTWAVIKAGLVGLYFMHLKYEGKWVYMLLIPAAFLATVLVFGMLPDATSGLSDAEVAADVAAGAPAVPAIRGVEPAAGAPR